MQPGNTHEATRRKASESRMLQISKSGSMRGKEKTVFGLRPVNPCSLPTLLGKFLLISFWLSAFVLAENNIKKINTELAPISYIVTASQYADFLNHVATTDPDFLYDQKMESDSQVASIVRLGTPEKFHYEVIAGREDYSVTFVDEKKAAAYAAWAESEPKTLSSISCNQAGFEVATASSAELSLAVTSTSTSNFTSCLEEASSIAGIIGLAAFGHELMMRPADEPVQGDEEQAISAVFRRTEVTAITEPCSPEPTARAQARTTLDHDGIQKKMNDQAQEAIKTTNTIKAAGTCEKKKQEAIAEYNVAVAKKAQKTILTESWSEKINEAFEGLKRQRDFYEKLDSAEYTELGACRKALDQVEEILKEFTKEFASMKTPSFSREEIEGDIQRNIIYKNQIDAACRLLKENTTRLAELKKEHPEINWNEINIDNLISELSMQNGKQSAVKSLMNQNKEKALKVLEQEIENQITTLAPRKMMVASGAAEQGAEWQKSSEDRKAQAKKEKEDQFVATRKQKFEAERERIASDVQDWIDITWNDLSSMNKINWKCPASSDAKKEIKSALTSYWEHLATFEIIPIIKEVASSPSFFKDANLAVKKNNETSRDGRSYGSNERRDQAVKDAEKRMNQAEKDAVNACNQWFISQFSNRVDGISFDDLEASFFEMIFEEYPNDLIRLTPRASDLKCAFKKAIEKNYSDLIKIEEQRTERIRKMGEDIFQRADEAWLQFVSATNELSDESLRYLPTKTGEIEKKVRTAESLAKDEEANAKQTYNDAIKQEAHDAFSSQHSKAAEGAWVARVNNLAKRIQEALYIWGKRMKDFDKIDSPVSEIDYQIATKDLNRIIGIAKANLAAWKAAWSEEFQAQEAVKAREYKALITQKIENDKMIDQLGKEVNQAKQNYEGSLTNLTEPQYVPITPNDPATKCRIANDYFSKYKEQYNAFIEAKDALVGVADLNRDELVAHQEVANIRVNEKKDALQEAKDKFFEISRLFPSYNEALQIYKKAKEDAAQKASAIHHRSTRTSKQKHIQDQFTALDAATAIESKAEVRLSNLGNELKGEGERLFGNNGNNSSQLADFYWSLAQQNIIKAEYAYYMAKKEIRYIKLLLLRF